MSSAVQAQANAPTKKLVAEFRIDGAREELSKITNILPISNGDVAVMLEEDVFGRLYSDKGLLKKKFLRRGGGPGEAKDAYASGMIADTIWLFDRALQRYSLVKPNGNFLRSWPLQPIGPWQDASPDRKLFRFVWPLAMLPNNIVIGQLGAAATATASGEVTTRPIVRMTWQGVVNGVVNLNPRAARAMMVRAGGIISFGQQPFDNAQEFGISPNGTHTVFADMKTAEKQPFFFLTDVSPKGDTVLRVKIPYTPDPVSARTIDSTVSAYSRNNKDVQTQYRAALYIAPYWPAVLKLLVANDGTAWLQMHTNNGTRQWAVVSPQGRLMMKIDLPKNIGLMRIDRGIWGTDLDSDDVPSIVRYKISN
ncbi:MAG: hypothetical protein ABJB74_20450 [Gemmatimonas sp.]